MTMAIDRDSITADVLKDGSAAAIYGTRGTNGVILITTKRASGGEKTTIEFSTYVAMQSVAKKLDVLTAEQFRSVINDYYPTMKDQYDFGASTDWFEEVTRKNPISQYYNVAFSGGSPTFIRKARQQHNKDQRYHQHIKLKGQHQIHWLQNIDRKARLLCHSRHI